MHQKVCKESRIHLGIPQFGLDQLAYQLLGTNGLVWKDINLTKNTGRLSYIHGK